MYYCTTPVVHAGSHAELLARGGKYAELWSAQGSVDDAADVVDAREREAGALSEKQ